MNKTITFKHITGSIKTIPGVSESDTSPLMRQKWIENNSEAGGKRYPVLVRDENHVVRIVLVSEDYDELSDNDKLLPKHIQRKLEDNAASDVLMRRDANRRVRDTLLTYERAGEIKIISEDEISPEELIKTNSPIVNLSEIALADHQSRNIPIPEHLQSHGLDTERIRAANAIAKAQNEQK